MNLKQKVSEILGMFIDEVIGKELGIKRLKSTYEEVTIKQGETFLEDKKGIALIVVGLDNSGDVVSINKEGFKIGNGDFKAFLGDVVYTKKAITTKLSAVQKKILNTKKGTLREEVLVKKYPETVFNVNIRAYNKTCSFVTILIK